MSYLKAKHLSELLVSKGLTISVAESCTGGSLSSSLTSISGASSYFNCGFITYSNQSKIDMLGVNPESIEMFGAVSEKVAHEMVIGAGQRSHSNLAVSISYGMSNVEFEAAAKVDQEDSGLAVSYTMGSMTVAAFQNKSDNVGGSTGVEDTITEISVAFAF